MDLAYKYLEQVMMTFSVNMRDIGIKIVSMVLAGVGFLINHLMKETWNITQKKEQGNSYGQMEMNIMEHGEIIVSKEAAPSVIMK